MRPRTILLVAAACLMVGMFGVAAGGVLFAPARPGELASSTQALLPSEPAGVARPLAKTMDAQATRMSAADLWMEYARDPAGADRRFRDRPVVVSGTVRSIERDFDGRLVVRLSTGDVLDTVNAKLAMRNDPAIWGVSKGKALSLGCVGHGALIGAPLLGGCSIL